MPRQTKDTVLTQQGSRLWIQRGGPRPGNRPLFGVTQTGPVILTGVSNPEQGSIEPIRIYDPFRPKRFTNVGRKASPADLPSATLTVLERTGFRIPWQLLEQSCPLNLYLYTGACGDMNQFAKGWEGYALILSHGEVTDKDLGDRMAWEDDDQIEDELDLTFESIYAIGRLNFDEGNSLAGVGSRGVRDIAFACNPNCGECGDVVSDGSQWIYALVGGLNTSGVISVTPKVMRSTNKGVTWITADIVATPAIAQGEALAVIGNFLVVLGADTSDTGGFWYAELSALGVPGSYTGIQTGFAAGIYPYDMFVLSPSEIIIVGESGYVWKSSDFHTGVTVVDKGVSTTQNLLAVHGRGDKLVAVGATGTVIHSNDRGDNWGVAAATPGAEALYSVAVVSDSIWWVGGPGGAVYYTLDGGNSWAQKTVPGLSGQVQGIYFVNDEVGFVVGQNSFATTWDGGETWTQTDPRLNNKPTVGQFRAIAVPECAPTGRRVNFVAFGGTAANNNDGVVFVAKADEF